MTKENLQIIGIGPLEIASNTNKYHDLIFEPAGGIVLVKTPFIGANGKPIEVLPSPRRVAIFENSPYWEAVQAARKAWGGPMVQDDQMCPTGTPEWHLEVECDGNLVAIPGEDLSKKAEKIANSRSSNAAQDPATMFAQLMSKMNTKP